jgi:hexosaminidase
MTMKGILSPLLLATAVAYAFAYETRHKVWPACQVELYTEASIVLRTVSPQGFIFSYTGLVDPILQAAEYRFLESLNKIVPTDTSGYPFNPESKVLWPLVGIRINVLTSDTDLRHGIDESYELEVRPVIDNDDHILLQSPTVYGALHGLQTLLQLLEFGWIDDSSSPTQGLPTYLIRDTPIQIIDAPTYPFRGLMIDTARHYMPVDLILTNLDVMAMNKMNVLHWHVTDSQSWPYESTSFPELSAKGAYCKECVYRQEHVALVIKEACTRGIRVIPEFDLPGHSQAVGASHPKLLTACGDSGAPREPLDVTEPAVYRFLYILYDEIADLWPDQWIHIGGDEVSLECWKTSTKIQTWMKDHNMTNELQLLAYFETNLMDFVTGVLKRRPIVWQELFDANVSLPKETVVDVWKSGDLNARNKATEQSYQVLISACWYLDHLNEDWRSFYKCDPRDFNGTSVQKELVIGGHASMWGERVDETDFLPRVWPRASATAEKLWTGNVSSAVHTAPERLEKFRCFMCQQGFPASPIAPGRCEYEQTDSLASEARQSILRNLKN